jgi:DivIVA domain-containing protein
VSRKRDAPAGPGWTSPVTPRDIRSATFRPSPVAWRGYSPVEVKELLDAAAGALQECHDDCVGLEAEVERLRYFYRNLSATTAALPAAGMEGRGIVTALRQYTATQVQQAVDYADGVAERPVEADRLLSQAKVRTAIVVEEAARAAGMPLRAAAAALGEVDQARLWVSCLAHALRVQAAAMHEVVEGRL